MPPRQTIRVLIVDDIDETRENIRRLLQFDSNIEVAGVAKDGKEALSVASKIDPDVIIMDINMPDMDGITATEAIRQKNPFSQVVILSVQGDQNYMRRAMMAGARDYLTKPPSIDELTSAINRAGEMSHEAREKAVSAFPVSSTGSGASSWQRPISRIQCHCRLQRQRAAAAAPRWQLTLLLRSILGENRRTRRSFSLTEVCSTATWPFFSTNRCGTPSPN